MASQQATTAKCVNSPNTMTSHNQLRIAGMFIILTSVCALVVGRPPSTDRRIGAESTASQGRFLWDILGNIITTSEYFPLELNVPDTIEAIVMGVSNTWTTVSDHIPKMLWHRLEELTTLFSP